jgi:hypothetical protein
MSSSSMVPELYLLRDGLPSVVDAATTTQRFKNTRENNTETAGPARPTGGGGTPEAGSAQKTAAAATCT